MENLEEYDILIADYFDNKMGPDEEQAFMAELGDNPGLRARFEEELEMQGFFYKENKPGGEEAIKPAGRVIKIDKPGSEKKKPGKVFFMPFATFMAVAASVLVIVSVAVVYLMKQNSGTGGHDTAGVAKQTTANPIDTTKNINPPQPAPARLAHNTSTKKDTSRPVMPALVVKDSSLAKINKTDDEDDGLGRPKPRKHDSLAGTLGDTATSTAKANAAFAKFYTVYTSTNDDPPAVSATYLNYKQGKYQQVVEARETAPQTNSTGGYLHLYKGLSYLALNSLPNALNQFNLVMAAFGKTQQLYYKAGWYKVLTLLKMNNATVAAPLAKDIAQSQSPYKNLASQLVAAL